MHGPKSCIANYYSVSIIMFKKYILGSVITGAVEILLGKYDLKMGIRAEMNQKARIGQPASKFKLVQPGLAGGANTVSFESEQYPSYFLQRKDKDVFLSPNSNLPEFGKLGKYVLLLICKMIIHDIFSIYLNVKPLY